jgi:CheY-like chemotaxis protein
MMPDIVLAIGLDPSLMTIRDLVLQSAGYAVVEASSLEEAVDHFQSGDFDLVLLCYSVPAGDRERLASLIRASGSRIPIVSIAGSLGECDTFANSTLEDGPNKFVAGIRDALSNAKKTQRREPALSCTSGDNKKDGHGNRSW